MIFQLPEFFFHLSSPLHSKKMSFKNKLDHNTGAVHYDRKPHKYQGDRQYFALNGYWVEIVISKSGYYNYGRIKRIK